MSAAEQTLAERRLAGTLMGIGVMAHVRPRISLDIARTLRLSAADAALERAAAELVRQLEARLQERL